MKILAIETSCDETAVCIIDAQGDWNADFSYTILGNALLSQTGHSQYGGVFPNLARREHELNLVPLLEKALQESHILEQGDALKFHATKVEEILHRENELRPQLLAFLKEHGRPNIDCIAVTHGPGLEPALWVGVNFARALASVWDLPIVPVNHMEGHIILSAVAGQESIKEQISNIKKIQFPLLSLLISGGHTELVLSKEWMHYELLGQTRDDAVGEAFDKVARLLDLPYPGGPEIDRLAQQARMNTAGTQINADAHLRESAGLKRTSAFTLPRPMIDSDDYDFSFSGLKTAVRRLVESKEKISEQMKMEIAREFEEACADVLVAKTLRAIEEHDVESLVVGGGVSANEYIRERLAESIKNYGLSTKLLVPPRELSTDNALMIALAGYFRAIKKEFAEPETILANGNLKLV